MLAAEAICMSHSEPVICSKNSDQNTRTV